MPPRQSSYRAQMHTLPTPEVGEDRHLFVEVAATDESGGRAEARAIVQTDR